MQNDNTILDELREISPLVASLNRQAGPYAVPAGYFDGLAETILGLIRSSVTDQDSAKAEVLAVSPLLAGIEKTPLSGLPQGYFEELPEKILKRVRAEEAGDAQEETSILSPFLGSLGKTNPFKAPEGYFAELSDNLTGGLKAIEFVNQELSHHSPLTGDLNRINPYTVPANYFDSLAEGILHRAKNQPQETKVIPFYNRKSWFKYAAAAALTGILITIGLFTFNRHEGIIDPLTALTKISDQEITNFLENQDIPLPGSSTNTTASLEMNDNDVKDLFNDIPDADLIQYSNERNGMKDLITN